MLQVLVLEDLECFHEKLRSHPSHLRLYQEAALCLQVAGIKLILLRPAPLEGYRRHSLLYLPHESVGPQDLRRVGVSTGLEHLYQPLNVELSPDLDPIDVCRLESAELELPIDYTEGPAYLSLVHLVRGQLLLVLQLLEEGLECLALRVTAKEAWTVLGFELLLLLSAFLSSFGIFLQDEL